MISSTLTIRTAEVADLSAVAALWGRLQKARSAFHPCHAPGKNVAAACRSELEELLQRENALFFVAVEPSGKVVGYCLGQIETRPASFAEAHYGVISSMFVDRAVRDGGVGHAMLQAAVDTCQRAGVARVEVTLCAENNDAIRFFERHRFGLNTVTLSRDI